MDERLLQDRPRKDLIDALHVIVSGNYTIGHEEEDFDVIVDELVYRRKHPEQDTTRENTD